MKSKLFLFLLGLAAFMVASVAAIFSVTGIGMLFSGHFLEVSIMAGSLEFSKLMLASFLYRKWDSISKVFKIYQVSALLILMTITSAGIFGYLSDSYQKTKSEYVQVDNKIQSYNTKKDFFNNRKERLISDKNSEIKSKLSNQTRADSLTARGIGISRTRKDILANETRINKYESEISSIEDSVNTINLKINKLKATTMSSDMGPLIYLSNVFNIPMDDVVKYFIFLLIFVFDPLAVSLVISTNMVIKHNNMEHSEDSSVEDININTEYEKTDEPNVVDASDNINIQDIIETKPEETIGEETKPKESKANKYTWKSANHH